MADSGGTETAAAASGNGSEKQDPRDLEIAIIGAGMGGLGCALALARQGFRKIHVYETASRLGFVGAGIQLAPNLVRILDRLGCWAGIEKDATVVASTSIRQGATNEELAHVDMPDIRQKYGHPHCLAHRASLAGEMFAACEREAAIGFSFACSLASVESFGPRPAFTVQPRGGEAYGVEADVLLAADGIKSLTRTQMLGRLGASGDEEETGQAAYRIMLRRSQMEHDGEMLALLDGDEVVRWIGEKRHIIAYPVAGKTIYNLSTTQPDTNFAAAPSATYTTRGDKSAMLAVFGDFCPLVRRMLDLVPEGEVCEWRLRAHKPLPAWVHGCVALLGDACHPTLPHLSQGAAMAIEDGAVLAEVLLRAPDLSPATLGRCLRVYELSRRDWCSGLVELAAANGRGLHLGEGKAREERDRVFRQHRASGGGAVPDKWASPDVQKMIYSNDCVENVRRDFDELFSRAGAQTETETETETGAGAGAKREGEAEADERPEGHKRQKSVAEGALEA